MNESEGKRVCFGMKKKKRKVGVEDDLCASLACST